MKATNRKIIKNTFPFHPVMATISNKFEKKNVLLMKKEFL